MSMSKTKSVTTIKDSTTFTLNETDLTEKSVGETILTPKREVSCPDGLIWWISIRPAGESEASKDHVSVFVWLNKSVKTKFSFAVDGFSKPYSKDDGFFFDPAPMGRGWSHYASHETLRPLFRDGKLTITCLVEFEVLTPITVPRVFQLFEHVPTDVEFVIESEKVPAHKNFLTLISPVFQGMFTHDTVESKSGVIDITEFDVDTVKAAMDVCYGREFEMSMDTVVGILRFCDKYLITAAINELEKQPLLYPSVESFSAVVQYAYECNKDALLADCYKFFKEHQDEIKATEKFAQLPLTLVITVIKFAFGLETDLEVLCHAGKNGIDFVVNPLEKTLIEPMTGSNFCTVVTYAWDCSREDLQQACAKFLNENRTEVDLDAFHNLPSDVVGNVVKASYVLQCGDKK